MDNLLEFNWWYILIAVIIFAIVKRGKGGVVTKRYEAKLVAVEPSFQGCKTEATYAVFKEGRPDHINIEIDNLPIAAGEEVELLMDGQRFARVKVNRRSSIDFDHWSDETTSFPVVSGGEDLCVRFQGSDLFKGTFS